MRQTTSHALNLKTRGSALKRTDFSLETFFEWRLQREAKRMDQRPSFIDEGKPLSHPRGEFHGRSERFSGSVVAHPVKRRPPQITSNAKKRTRTKVFIGLID